MSNNKISYFTHWIKVNDDEYQIDPRFGEDNYVNSLKEDLSFDSSINQGFLIENPENNSDLLSL